MEMTVHLARTGAYSFYTNVENITSKRIKISVLSKTYIPVISLIGIVGTREFFEFLFIFMKSGNQLKYNHALV